jgi:hypothetical protein
MTNAERVLAYLRSISPREATNDEIVRGSGVQPHQQVFQITQRLLSEGTIAGSRAGGIWRFSVETYSRDETDQSSAVEHEEVGIGRAEAARGFEGLAQRVMSEHYGATLRARKLAGVP